MRLAQVKLNSADLHPFIGISEFMRVVSETPSQVYLERSNGEEVALPSCDVDVNEYSVAFWNSIVNGEYK